uniref:Uncharacterized protein n=1 Tax=Heliothis virescens TaxID=7102 RepID=A0A2A4JQS6_HELVI
MCRECISFGALHGHALWPSTCRARVRACGGWLRPAAGVTPPPAAGGARGAGRAGRPGWPSGCSTCRRACGAHVALSVRAALASPPSSILPRTASGTVVSTVPSRVVFTVTRLQQRLSVLERTGTARDAGPLNVWTNTDISTWGLIPMVRAPRAGACRRAASCASWHHNRPRRTQLHHVIHTFSALSRQARTLVGGLY